jgi:hypothetical protein
MAELAEADKERIVLLLARFKRPAEVVAIMAEEFGVETTVQQVRTYDPTNPRFEASEKWRPIFEAARKAYIEDVSIVPVASQGYRLQLLQEGIDAAKKVKNWGMVASLTEQAAKEVGGVLTNERNLRVDDSRRQRVADMTPEDRRLALAEIIRVAAEKIAEKAGAKPTPPPNAQGSASVQ